MINKVPVDPAIASSRWLGDLFVVQDFWWSLGDPRGLIFFDVTDVFCWIFLYPKWSQQDNFWGEPDPQEFRLRIQRAFALQCRGVQRLKRHQNNSEDSLEWVDLVACSEYCRVNPMPQTIPNDTRNWWDWNHTQTCRLIALGFPH